MLLEKSGNTNIFDILKSLIFSYVSVLEYDYKVSEAGEMQAGQDAGWHMGDQIKRKAW